MSPLTNAERQKRWREKRNALAKAAAQGGADPERIDAFLQNVAAVLKVLETEGRKDLATFSPNTVRRAVHMLQTQVEAMRANEELPELPPSLRRHLTT